MTTIIGFLAAICTTFAFLPQVIKTWRSGRADDISIPMYLVFITGAFLWMVYGIRLGEWPLIAANIVTMGFSSSVLIMAVKYRAEAKQSIQ